MKWNPIPGFSLQAMPNLGAPSSPVAPHDIEELLPYVVPWWQYALGIAAALVFLATALALWYWLKNRKKVEQVVSVDHWDELSKRLQALQTEQMIASGQAKEFFFQLSLILRSAIELATDLRATDMTYRELAPLMENKLSVKTEDLRLMQEFLYIADLVKFADRETTQGEGIHFKQAVMLWTSALKPRQEVGLPAEQMRKVKEVHG